MAAGMPSLSAPRERDPSYRVVGDIGACPPFLL